MAEEIPTSIPTAIPTSIPAAIQSLDGCPVGSAMSIGDSKIVFEVGFDDDAVKRLLVEEAGFLRVLDCKEGEGTTRCRFKDIATAEAIIEGKQNPHGAVASGALRVSGDWRVLSKLGKLMAHAKRRNLVVADAKIRDRDGVGFYTVRYGAATIERRFSEFVALRAALKREGCHVRAKLPGPGARFNLTNCGVMDARKAGLEIWLRAAFDTVQTGPQRRKLAEFLGVKKLDEESESEPLPAAAAVEEDLSVVGVLKKKIATLEDRVREPERVVCRLLAAAMLLWARIVTALVTFVGFAAVAWLCKWRIVGLVGIGCGMYFYVTERIFDHVVRSLCFLSAGGAWKAAKYCTALLDDDGPSDSDKTPTRRFGLAGERSLLESFALRYLGEIIAAIATMEQGLLVKLAQFLSSFRGLLAPEITDPLAKLTDAMPPMSGTARDRVAAGIKNHAARTAIQEAPVVASASIAQVHKWKEVALKVQKPGLKRKFTIELRSFRFVAGMTMWIEPAAPDLRSLMDEAYKMHIRELDFSAEAKALDAARGIVEKFKLDAVVPEPLRDIADPKTGVLAMQWCRGVKIARKTFDGTGVILTDGTLIGSNLVKDLAEKLLNAYAAIFLVGGLVNQDPHGGNCLCETYVDPTKNGALQARPVLLDFGMHEFLPDTIRLGFAALLLAVADNDIDGLATALRDLGVASTFPAEHSMLHINFLFRDSTTHADAEVDAIADFLDQYEDHAALAKSSATAANRRMVEGGEVFQALARQLDLLHGYVAGLPVHLDFLGIYAKWARNALLLEESSSSRNPREQQTP